MGSMGEDDKMSDIDRKKAEVRASLEGASEDELRQICQEYYNTMWKVESEKYDEEFELMKKDFEINELNIAVNDLRGKFIKPTLKKVSKYENKFAKLQKKAS